VLDLEAILGWDGKRRHGDAMIPIWWGKVVSRDEMRLKIKDVDGYDGEEYVGLLRMVDLLRAEVSSGCYSSW
jgi:hypothetical protein